MPQDRYTNNSTAYEHPQESNLLNIHKTMQYNSTGQPVARVHVDGITLEGDVIVDTVSLSSSTLAALETVNVIQSSTPWVITGSVVVGNFPTSVTVTNFTSTVNVASIPAISGTVVVSNFTSTVNIANTVTVNQGTNPWQISGNVIASVTGTVTQALVPEATDAFGRTRVSNPTTLADYHHVGAENPEMILKVSGAGTGSLNTLTSAYVLSVGTGTNDYAIHQSSMYHHYLPGKSQLINSSFMLGSPRANTVKRVGYFDDFNGIFFEQAGDGTLSWVERRYVNGIITENRITQSDWNKDTCNTSILGTSAGAANFGRPGTWTLDITKTQLIYLDFQWLGVGRLRVGFVHNGLWVIAHEFYHSNILPTVYWTQPSLPIRCEIRNTGSAVGTASMDQICSTVMSEGGYFETGLVNSIRSSLLGRELTNGGSTLPIIAIRLKNSFNGGPVRGIVRIQQVGMLCTNGPVYYELRRFNSHTAITGGSWQSYSDDSIIEYNTTATGYTDGVAVAGDFLSAAAAKGTTSQGSIDNPVANKRGFITQNYDSTDSNCYALVATALGNQNNIQIQVYGSIQWSETR
jgi:hypothetical protein